MISHPLRIAITTIAVLGAAWLLWAQLAAPAGASSAAPDDERAGAPVEAPPFRPVARVSSLMRGMGGAVQQLRDVFPQTEEEHRLGSIAAWSDVIAELSNVHTRHRRKPDYLAMAADTRARALELARAARADAPDEERLWALFTDLDSSCATCHDSDS